ncbi:MAG: iron chaperone [Actinomycetota bacterium]
MEKPASVEAYLKGLTPQQRSAVQKLRETIAAAAPDADEGITYSMPGFLLGGKGLMAYAAFSDHYSFFPMSMRAIDAHRDELGSRVTGKGTIAFEYGRPLPTALVKKIVKTRLAEAEARRARK